MSVSSVERPVSPLRQRMLEDMAMRGLRSDTQREYIRFVRDFAAFLGQRPDTATAEDVRRFQVHQRESGVQPPTINCSVSALRFFFTVTLDRPDLSRRLVLARYQRKAPAVLSVEEVGRLLESAPGAKYKAILGAAYGAGLRVSAAAVRQLAERTGAVVVLSPNSVGVLPDDHPQNMHVGGSKGSISVNFAMEEAELLIVAGSRAVCQSDCSGTGYPKVQHVININGELADASHYNRTTALLGDLNAVIERLLETLGNVERSEQLAKTSSGWLAACVNKKAAWTALRDSRTRGRPMRDPAWGREVLTQPTAVGVVQAFASRLQALKIFDAGDVQANGFQISDDSTPFETVTESGASYMGFAASSLLASAAADAPRYMIAFSGDGSFVMNPQILVDAAVHRVRGMVAVFDNRRMGAISSLQEAQFNNNYGTNDHVAVDFVAMASAVAGVKGVFGGYSVAELEHALDEAYAHMGLSVVHVPVYWGEEPAGGMGAYGRWNVGPWVDDVERRYADQNI
jgi:3D-(3,5/4)-trihydroxycyclohexane-1,2-dione acylhydrolase (decyclizing)